MTGPTRSSSAAGLGNIKGVAFREFAVWYANNVSRNHVQSVVAALEPLHPNTFDSTRDGYGILATRWYDARLVHTFLDRLVVPGGGHDTDQLTQTAATDIMGRTLSGVYKFLFSTFASPQLYARHANKLWSLHYDTGVVTVEQGREPVATVRYTDWVGHHPLICKLNMGACLPIYSAMGCRNVGWSKKSCTDDGDHSCQMTVRWDP